MLGDAWYFEFSSSWSWRPLKLTPLQGISMPPRQSHTVVWAFSGRAWVFGGMDDRSRMRNDLWEIAVYEDTVQPLHTSCPLCARPGSRALHAAATDHEGTMWIFGGHAYQDTKILYLGDLWRVRCRMVANGTCAHVRLARMQLQRSRPVLTSRVKRPPPIAALAGALRQSHSDPLPRRAGAATRIRRAICMSRRRRLAAGCSGSIWASSSTTGIT